MEQQIVWITGASSGIGEACALAYAAQGDKLILTATTSTRLQTVAEKCRKMGAEVALLPFNLEETAGIYALVEQAWNLFGHVDVLFCNAGISQRTSVEDTSMEMLERIMRIDFYAPVAMAKAILPKMLSDGGGHVAVTTSIAGKFGFPLRCAYSAAKHALDGFFETLQAEYSDKGIVTTLVCPGRVQTQISVNALDKGGQKHGLMDPGQAGGITADKAAKKIVRSIAKGRREVFVGGKELAMVWVKRFFPNICSSIAKKIKPM